MLDTRNVEQTKDCNSIQSSLVNRLLRAILIITNPLLRVYINQYFSMHLQFDIQLQCIQTY